MIYNNTIFNLFFNILKDFYKMYRELPTCSSFVNELQKNEFVEQELDTIADYTVRLFTEPINNKEYAKSQLIDFIKHQKMLRTLRGAKDNLKSGNFDNIYKEIKEAHSITGEDNLLGAELVSDFSNVVDKLDEHPQQLIVPTGIAFLDEKIGGLAKGELGFFLSVSAGGKSTTLINVGIGAIRSNLKVVYINTGNY